MSFLRLSFVTACLMLAGSCVTAAEARARPSYARRVSARLVPDRIVMLMRHGIRAPLDGEVPDGTRIARPWPRWPVPPSQLTPRGAQAMAILGRADRRWLATTGLLPANGCPRDGQVRVHANTAQRTIASGDAFLTGFAPGCAIHADHLPSAATDPIFEPLRAGSTRFDAVRAVAAIDRFTGGAEALARRHAATIRLLDKTLGCGLAAGCSPLAPSRVTPAADGRGIDLSGPIRITSGTAQVLLLAYAEGLDVGASPADAATLRRLGALHAALFDVFTRSPYMAAHQAAVLGRHMLDALADPAGPRVDVLVGHDTNVTALAAALHVDLVAPGYATNDVAPGGALLLERLHDPASGRAYVRAFYRTQSPTDLRTLAEQVTMTPLRIHGCGADGLCEAAAFDRLLRGRLAALANATRRMNQIQVIGSHNSFKDRIPPAVMATIRGRDPKAAAALDYYHLPLAAQLDHGVRQLEIDVFADPSGGRYADPGGEAIAWRAGERTGFDHAAMLRPGYKVLHVPDIDYRSTCATLIRCLIQIDRWSRAHPRHLPIMVTINAADAGPDAPGVTAPLPLDDAARLDALDTEIRRALPGRRLITPDEVRGTAATLRDAIRTRGWPTLAATRGRLYLVLDVREAVAEVYRAGHRSLAGRAMFGVYPDDQPESAVQIVQDPVADGERIRRWVDQGLIVRTRADANTVEARAHDPARAAAAAASGAQAISTDYYPGAPDPAGLQFRVTLPAGAMTRCQPAGGAGDCAESR